MKPLSKHDIETARDTIDLVTRGEFRSWTRRTMLRGAFRVSMIRFAIDPSAVEVLLSLLDWSASSDAEPTRPSLVSRGAGGPTSAPGMLAAALTDALDASRGGDINSHVHNLSSSNVTALARPVANAINDFVDEWRTRTSAGLNSTRRLTEALVEGIGPALAVELDRRLS